MKDRRMGFDSLIIQSLTVSYFHGLPSRPITKDIIIDNEFTSTEIHEEQLLIILGVETNGKHLLGERFYE